MAEQLVVLGLCIASFAAGWIARDPPLRRRAQVEAGEGPDGPAAELEAPAVPPAPEAVAAPVVTPALEPEPEPVPPARPAPELPDPGTVALRALDAAGDALRVAVE